MENAIWHFKLSIDFRAEQLDIFNINVSYMIEAAW